MNIAAEEKVEQEDVHEHTAAGASAAATVPDAELRIDLPVTGMTCAACARRIERRLSKAEGVSACNVNFATGRATVAYDPRRTGVRELMQTVRDVGYGTSGVAAAEFVVDDSARVSGTAQVLEHHLKAARGVVSAGFNLATMRVRVEFLETGTDARSIRKRIEELGYRVSEVTADDARTSLEREEEARAFEWRDLWRRFAVAAALSLPVLFIAMSHGAVALFDVPWINWLQLALTAPVVFYSGAPFYRGAWAALRHRAADMNTLIAVGTGAAFLYSLVATVAPRWVTTNAHEAMGMGGAGAPMTPVYFEAAAVIIALILLGRLLEARAKGRTSEAVRKLVGLQPRTARVVREGGRHEDVPADEVVPGDMVLVRPGEKVPTDGLEGAGRRGGGRDGQRRGRAHLPRHARRARHGLAADRPHGRGGAREPRAGRATGRHGERLLHAHRHRRRRRHLRRLVRRRARGDAPDRGARPLRLRPDHRVPVRAGAGDADGRHGRHGPRGRGRRPLQGRRGAGGGAQAPGRHPRQDRHHHGGQARRHGHRAERHDER
jgi:copper chaperone CopZ